MRETIYTIPVNEAFEEKCTCPVCRMYDKIEQDELERITGASMMEPSVRIETNKHGFCVRHWKEVANMGKALPTALMMDTYLQGLVNDLGKPLLGSWGDKAEKQISARLEDCYLCGRIDDFFSHEIETVFQLWKEEKDFRVRFEEQKSFCLPHAGLLLAAGKKYLSKKDYPEFADKLLTVTVTGFRALQGDMAWFCQKFDYRNQDADWKNSKDAIPRAVKLLTGKDK